MIRTITKLVNITCLVALLTLMWVPQSLAEEKLDWILGEGQKVTLGNDLAELQLGEDFGFLNGENTKKYEVNNGFKPSDNEIGLVVPVDESQRWEIYFEYRDSGHIKDDEKADIDADALLESYIKGTEQMNEELAPENQLFVDGWDVKPFYDSAQHSLSWSLLAHDNANEKLINYNMRILTREGYIAAILVSDPEHLAEDRKILTEQILPKLTIKQGKRYEDFNETTDKLAEYGLTGLILGGAGLAVAKKAGLIAVLIVLIKKFWIVVIVAIGALWNFIRKKIGKGKKQSIPTESQTPIDPPIDHSQN